MRIDPSKIVWCDQCQYNGPISTYKPTFSAYTDIRCPECGSTNNEHNGEYLNRLMKKRQKVTVRRVHDVEPPDVFEFNAEVYRDGNMTRLIFPKSIIFRDGDQMEITG